MSYTTCTSHSFSSYCNDWLAHKFHLQFQFTIELINKVTINDHTIGIFRTRIEYIKPFVRVLASGTLIRRVHYTASSHTILWSWSCFSMRFSTFKTWNPTRRLGRIISNLTSSQSEYMRNWKPCGKLSVIRSSPRSRRKFTFVSIDQSRIHQFRPSPLFPLMRFLSILLIFRANYSL